MLKLPELPYAYDALEPYISEATLRVHHLKHHRAYVENVIYLEALRDSVGGMHWEDRSLEEIIQDTAEQQRFVSFFNNAAQSWNHEFYWNSMRPQGGGEPYGEIKRKIVKDFGDYRSFIQHFALKATRHFGSGWAWLVLDGDKLRITTTANADTPIVHGHTPLFAIDLWEHAYYLDYQDRRAAYVTAFMEHLANWDFVNQNLVRSKQSPGFLVSPRSQALARVGT